jgi:hypothetical protein
MGCDILIIGVNSASVNIPTSETAAQHLSRLFNNQSSRTNESVLFQLAHPVTLLCGSSASRVCVGKELTNLGKRCCKSNDMAIVAFFGGSKYESAFCLECADGFIDLEHMRHALRFVKRVCYILDCRFAAFFIDTLRLQDFTSDTAQRVAAIASTREHAFSVLLPVHGWHNMFASALLNCPITDLEFDLDGLKAGDLVVTLTLWFESTQARFAHSQLAFQKHTIVMQNDLYDSSKSSANHFFSQHVEWFVSPNFSLSETILANNNSQNSEITTLLV